MMNKKFRWLLAGALICVGHASAEIIVEADFVGADVIRGLTMNTNDYPLGYWTAAQAALDSDALNDHIGVAGGSSDRRSHQPILVFDLPEEGPVISALLTFYKGDDNSSTQRDADLYGLDPREDGFEFDIGMFWDNNAQDTRDFVTLIEAPAMQATDAAHTKYEVDVTSYIQSFYDGTTRLEDQAYFRLNLNASQWTGLRRMSIHIEDDEGLGVEAPSLLVTIPEPATAGLFVFALAVLKMFRRRLHA